MNIEGIKKLASSEHVVIEGEIKRIQSIRDMYPEGKDFTVSLNLVEAVEEYCDRNFIPFFRVTSNGCCSTARTYKKLLAREEKR